jgi:hypothetical protein
MIRVGLRMIEYPEDLVRKVCGAAAATYVANKSRGGRNNANGRDYEVMYGAFRIVLLAAEALRAGDRGSQTTVADQLRCFVDDLAIDSPAQRTLSQVKSGAASWTAGEHPVADDFRSQRRLDREIGLSPVYELVVADRDRQRVLLDSRPEDVEANVTFFCDASKLCDLSREHPELLDALDELSARPPRSLVREQTFQTFVGAWFTSNGPVTLASVVNKASTGPDALIRPLGESYSLPANVAAALEAIPDFEFEIRRNHLWYGCKGLEGYAAYHCLSDGFREFERFVLERRPDSFVALHAALRGHT